MAKVKLRRDTISDLKHRLAEHAEAVCRYYLFNGRRAGNYWIVGDIHNTPGRSLYVRLRGPLDGPAAAGRWRDAATGERGDLLNLIAATRGLRDMGAILDEARRFLSLPPPEFTAYIPTPTGRPKRPGGCSSRQNRSPAHWPKRICIGAALRRSAASPRSAFTRTATIARGKTRRTRCTPPALL
jgi:hypothetical protein